MVCKNLTLGLAAAALLLGGGGCAPKNWSVEDDGAYDELEPINRQIYKINKGVDWLVIKPVARYYDWTMPAPLRHGIGNVLDNLQEGSNIANNILQRQGTGAINSAARLVFNSTFGIGGIFDVATPMGIPEKKADFGQTLRAYGLDNTTYLMLPVLGPSTVADAAGTVADGQLYAPAYLSREKTQAAFYGTAAAEARAQFLETEALVRGAALDEYSFIRDVYEERRRAETPHDVWTAPGLGLSLWGF